LLKQRLIQGSVEPLIKSLNPLYIGLSSYNVSFMLA